MSVSENSVPVGYGTVGGLLATVGSIAGGLILLLVGKTPAEKDAGVKLLSQAAPVAAVGTIISRGIQAKSGVKLSASEFAVPKALQPIAEAGLALVTSSPDGVDGSHVALATEDSPPPIPAPAPPPPAA